MPRVLRQFALLLTLAGAVLAMGACGASGGGSGSGSGDAAQLVKDTFRNGQKVRSGRLDVALALKLDGLASLIKPIRITFGGPFDKPTAKAVPRFAFDVSLQLGGKPFTAGATATGGRVFFALQGDDYELPAASAKTFRDAFSRLQSIAQPKLNAKGDVPWLADPKVEGDVDVAGTPTTRVSAKVDVRKLLDQLGGGGSGAKLTAKQKADVVQAIKDPRLELFTGKRDKILRRVKARFRLDLPQSLRSQAGGLKGADVAVDYSIAELNQPQKIVAPTSTKPVGQLVTRLQSILQIFQSVFGGVLGGGGASGSGAGGSAGSSSGAEQQYGQCLTQAGNDIAEAQKCARLLN